MINTCPLVAPRHRSTATVSIFRMTNACTPLATPMPPSSSATRPTMPRKFPSWSMDCVRLNSFSATVRNRTRGVSVEKRWLKRAAKRAGVSDGGTLSSAWYSARLPKISNPVSWTYFSGMKTRGPMAALTPRSPGTARTAARMTNRALPRRSVSPSCASSETSSDGSTIA